MKHWVFLFRFNGRVCIGRKRSGSEMLRGRVIDAELGEPIFSANVIVEGTQTGDDRL